MNINNANINRFSGFAELYNNHRPSPPDVLRDIIIKYCTEFDKNKSTVVDIGCGTGLSTRLWSGFSPEIIGIEPNDDMRKTAENQTENTTVKYIHGFSNKTGLSNEFADIVTISQAFHWMDIKSTLVEVSRILKNRGVLAIYDAIQPPSIGLEIELLHKEFVSKLPIHRTETIHGVNKNDKSKYLQNVIDSELFSFCREVLVHKTCKYSANDLLGFTLSLGGVQSALKEVSNGEQLINEYYEKLLKYCDDKTIEGIISYRTILAVK